MPSYDVQIAKGRGKFRARAVIGGWPYIPVSHHSLVRTLADGREQIVGLNPLSIRIAARADLARAELREQEMSLELIDTRPQYLMTRAFHRVPTLTTWLTAEIDESDTTIPVADTAGWPSSGVIHIGTEAIAYTNKIATEFQGCTRGYWDSPAQAHFIGSGDRVWFPPVTDLPRALTGRRIYFYFYGSGDPSSGDGELRWRGVAHSDVSFAEDVYTISVEPLSRVLEQELGGDLGEEVGIRGVYLPARAALTATIDLLASAAQTASVTDTLRVELSGFFRDNAEVVDALNTQIAAGTAGWPWDADASLTAEVTDGGYRFVYRAGSGTAHYVRISGGQVAFDTPGERDEPPWPSGISPVDLFVSADARGESASGAWHDGSALLPFGGSIAVATTYTMDISAPVPRAVGARVVHWFDETFSDSTTSPTTYPIGRLYLAGTLVPTADTEALVTNEDGEEAVPRRVTAVDTVDRWIVAGGFSAPSLGASTKIRLARVFARGTVANLIQALIDDSAGLVNAGAMPLLLSGEFDPSSDVVNAAVSGLGLGASRAFSAAEGVTLGEMLAEELKLIGCYLALDATGALCIKRLTPVTTTDRTVATLDSSTVRGAWPQTSMSPSGILTSVLLEQGWNALEAEHQGTPIRVRNTTSPTHIGGTLRIAPRSRTSDEIEVQPEAVYLLASAVLAQFGAPYEVISLQAGLESFELVLGATVLLTSPLLPGPDGTRGVTARAMQLVGYDWSPWEARGSFELHAHDRRIAGYAPGAMIASQVDNGGNDWTLTVAISDYTTGAADDWFELGDEVRITEVDTRTPTRVSGTVITSTATTIRVQLDGVWNPAAGTAEWRVGYDRAPSADTEAPSGRRWAQSSFAYVGGTDGRVGFTGGDVDAPEFA